MINFQVIQELQKKLPGLLISFGGTNLFLSYIKEALKINRRDSFNSLTKSQKLELFNYIYLLLTYKNNIILISPWNLFIDLRNSSQYSNDFQKIASINIEEPYKVYNLNGDLLYTVKSHLGVFGESRLDKNLILNSVNTSSYFLKYRTYDGGEKTKLIIVNLHSSHSNKTNQNFDILDQNATSTLSIINETNAPVILFKTDAPLIVNTTFVFNDSKNKFIINKDDVKIFNIDTSAYLLIETPTQITQTYVTYPSSNLIFIDNPQTPIFIGTNIDVTLLNKKFNKSIQFSNKPLNDIITLTPFS